MWNKNYKTYKHLSVKVTLNIYCGKNVSKILTSRIISDISHAKQADPLVFLNSHLSHLCLEESK